MPDIPIGKLTTLQENVATLISATAEITAAGLQVITSKKGSIQSQLDEAMAGLNAAVIVYPPSATLETYETNNVHFERVALTLRISVWPENFESTAHDVAELLLRKLHRALVEVGDGYSVSLLPEKQGEVIFPIDHPSFDMVDVLFFTQFGLDQYPSS